jgi:acyl carrier protein
MDLWLSVEQTLKVDIPEKEVRKCETITDLIDLIERYMKG